MERLAPCALPSSSPYGALSKRGSRWYLEDARPDVTMMLRRIFSALPHEEDRVLPLPTTLPGFWIRFNWFLKLFPLALAERYREAFEKELAGSLDHARQVEAFHARIEQPSVVDLPLKISLREYQKKAVEAIAIQKRILVGDEVGLGKSATAIASILRERTLPVLWVTMTQLSQQIVREFAKFTPTVCVDPEKRFFMVDERRKTLDNPRPGSLIIHQLESLSPYTLPPAHVYVIKYSCLRGWHDFFTRVRFRFVVFDECQELRHNSTSKYKAARELTRHPDFVVGLTATPIYNYGDEIYNVIDVINSGCLGRRTEFLAEWGRMEGSSRFIVSDPKALGAMLREELFMIRRTREQVGLELPEVQHVVEYVDHDVDLFNREKQAIIELAKKTLFGFSEEERVFSSGQLDVQLRKATGLAKAHYVAARTRILLESGEPVILVGWHRDAYAIWLKHLQEFNPVLITGSESPKQKDANKLAFIEGRSQLLILSLRSGEGLDGLQHRASVLVFGELDWSPQVHHQIIGRLHRFGQKHSVLTLYLLSREGSDPIMENLLDLKSEQSFKILNPQEEFLPVGSSTSGRKRLRSIAESILHRYEVDLEGARRQFQQKEPEELWDILAALEGFTWDRSQEEKACQRKLEMRFREAGVEIRREAPLERGVVDFLSSGGVAVEVKTRSVAQSALLQQLRNYAACDEVKALIVVAPEATGMPAQLMGKRIREVRLREAAVLSSG